jgi:hypothetical protein
VIKKIISGGQTGADQAALDAAIKLGFPHGGWISKGRRTEDGPLSTEYDLQEMSTSSYPKRTEQNLIKSDGTVIISRGKLTGGSKLTEKLAKKHNKPFRHIDLNKIPTFLAASIINSLITEHNIEILNVAGPRASKDPEIYRDVKYIVEGVILLGLVKASAGNLSTDYEVDEYLEKLPPPPKTVDEAVNRLIADLDLKAKVTIVNMDLDDLVNLHSNLFTYFKNAFGLWSGNNELMASCRAISKTPVKDQTDATAVIIGVLWKKLQDHKLRVVR